MSMINPFCLTIAPLLAASAALSFATSALAFEGRITVQLTRGGETNALRYTVSGDRVRVEVTATNRPNPIDIVDLKSGTLTLVFPHNRSFVETKPGAGAGLAPQPANAATPALPVPPGLGPQPGGGAGASAMPAMPAMPTLPGTGPRMPMIPPTMGPEQKMELKATGQTTNILGFACARYEIEQRGDRLEIWATDKLFAFQAYVRNQAPRFGPRRIEDVWTAMLAAQKLFPLRASLRLQSGPEHWRFEVQSVEPGRIADEEAARLFQPPADYRAVEPLPF